MHLFDMVSMPGSVSWGLVLRVSGGLLLLEMLHQLYRLLRVRMHVRWAAREAGIPMMPHNLLLGHLISVGKVMSKYPRDVAGQIVIHYLMQDYPDLCGDGIFYFDGWPIGGPMLVVTDPAMQAQFTQEHSLYKSEFIRDTFIHMSRGKDLVTSEGLHWKTWRSVFNPGFSAKNVTAMVPGMVEEVLVFREFLREAAQRREVIKMEECAQKLTVDIIGRVALGIRLHVQKKAHPFFEAMTTMVSWFSFDLAPLKIYNPIRPLVLWNCNRIMRRELLPLIEQCVDDFDRTEGPKTVLNLAIKAYVDEVMRGSSAAGGSKLGEKNSTIVDPDFTDLVIDHLKMFIFAGTDTTTTTLCWAYYLLGENPDKLARLRAEHDAVLGADLDAAAGLIAASPHLLNQLPYTQAVLKETLRLYPPVGTVRQGEKGFHLTHPRTGVRYPTEGFVVFGCSHATQRDGRLWPEADAFLPERWLVSSAAAGEGEGDHHPMPHAAPPRNAWRPFELGPRNCIGQELAQIELRLILAMTAREFDVESRYPDEAHGGARVLGRLGYQTKTDKDVTAHPKDGLPVSIGFNAGR